MLIWSISTCIFQREIMFKLLSYEILSLMNILPEILIFITSNLYNLDLWYDFLLVALEVYYFVRLCFFWKSLAASFALTKVHNLRVITF